MDLLRAVFTHNNIVKIAMASGTGFVVAGLSSALFTGSTDRTTDDLRQHEFLGYDEEVLSQLQDLRELLLINSRTVPPVFHRLATDLNVLVGYDYLIDTGNVIGLDLNYTIQAIAQQCNTDLMQVLKIPCPITGVMTEICSIVETLQEKISNITYNMNQEIRLRIMDSNY
jgi:hypothetical protein